jgi:uncharacterized membrane protein
MSKEDLSPEDNAYYKRFKIKPLRVLLYLVAVIYLVLVYGVSGSQFSLALLSGAVGTFLLTQGINRRNRRLALIGAFLTTVSVVRTVVSIV